VAILTVDRPAVGNAIGLATMDALDQAMDAFDQAVDAAADADVLVARGSGDPHHHPAHEESSAAFAILFVDLRRHRAAVAGGQPS
jgi:hypothetical protein